MNTSEEAAVLGGMIKRIQALEHAASRNPAAFGDVTANDISVNGASLPRGVMGYASRTSDQNGITTMVDLTDLTVTWTAVDGRLYRVNYALELTGTVAGDLVLMSVTDAANVGIHRHLLTAPPTISGLWYGGMTGSCLTTAIGSTTRKLRLERNAGTGVINSRGNASWPAMISVEDIGTS